jgi:hypothetical protein
MANKMIKEVTGVKDLKRFIYFVKDLYKDSEHYIYPSFYIVFKELKKEVLVTKSSKAILSLSDDKLLGRLLYTFKYNQKFDKNVCYFSYFDCIDSSTVANELFLYMEADMKNNKIVYSEGTYSPFDPDNRRGILVKGFDDDPVIFTSYNYPYYESLLINYGYKKIHDTVSLQPVISEENERKLNALVSMFKRRFNVEVSTIDLKNIDSELEDIHKIFEVATTDLLYQEAPSLDMIRKVAKSLKPLIKKEIVIIAREKDSQEPIGFAVCLLDYNQIFKLTKGRLNILKFLRPKKYINRSRAMMQYVVPKYQSSGLIIAIYDKIYEGFKKLGIKSFEAGTIMEENFKSMTSFSKFGGEVKKIYRIFGKEI